MQPCAPVRRGPGWVGTASSGEYQACNRDWPLQSSAFRPCGAGRDCTAGSWFGEDSAGRSAVRALADSPTAQGSIGIADAAAVETGPDWAARESSRAGYEMSAGALVAGEVDGVEWEANADESAAAGVVGAAAVGDAVEVVVVAVVVAGSAGIAAVTV